MSLVVRPRNVLIVNSGCKVNDHLELQMNVSAVWQSFEESCVGAASSAGDLLELEEGLHGHGTVAGQMHDP